MKVGRHVPKREKCPRCGRWFLLHHVSGCVYCDWTGCNDCYWNIHRGSHPHLKEIDDMPIIVKDNAEGRDFTPAPAGVHAAVCCDVRDLGMLPGFQGKPQHKLLVSWLIDENRDDGKPYMVSKRYTASLNEKASLTADLESWRGKAFTEAEKDGFDVEVLIGKGCMLNVVHKASQDGKKVYANVISVMPLAKGMTAPKIPSDFVRFVDRPVDDGPPAHEDQHAPPSDDEIPF